MVESLIEELPKIISRGKKVAQRMLDDISSENRITLQTNEFVLPTKAAGGLSEYFGQSTKESHDQKWTNRMIYGDNLLVMQALLAGDPKQDYLQCEVRLILSTLILRLIQKQITEQKFIFLIRTLNSNLE